MNDATTPQTMTVLVAYALPEQQWVESVSVSRGATVQQVLDAARSIPPFDGANPDVRIDLDAVPTGVWGEPCDRDRVLREGDRVELYRPLAVDPMTARREAAKRSD